MVKFTNLTGEKIASIIQEPELEITPLNKKIGIFSKQIAVLVVGLVLCKNPC